jgi:protein TonB
MEAPVQEDWVTFAEQMPQFPGGEEAFKAYLTANLRYPEMEREQGIEGTVYLSIIVEPNGAVTNVTVLRGVNGGPGLTREAIRLLKAMPTWTPGRTNGKAMRVKMNVPVKFRLE